MARAVPGVPAEFLPTPHGDTPGDPQGPRRHAETQVLLVRGGEGQAASLAPHWCAGAPTSPTHYDPLAPSPVALPTRGRSPPPSPGAHLSGLRSLAGLAGPSASSVILRRPSALRLRPRLHLPGGGVLRTRGRVRAGEAGRDAAAPVPCPECPRRAARPHLVSWSLRLRYLGGLRGQQAMSSATTACT